MLQGIRKNQRLPQILGQKIKIGNSLVSGTKEELIPFFGENWEEARPFNWKHEYPEVFEKGGFSVIIGNPPYEVLIRSQTDPGLLEYLKKGQTRYAVIDQPGSKNGYLSAEYNPNLFVLFIERCLDLLKKGGLLGFIIQNTLFTNVYFKNIRKLILDNCKIVEIADLRYAVFADAVIDSSILILEKESDENKRNSNRVKVILNIQNIENQPDSNNIITFDQSFFNDPGTDYRFSIFLQPRVKAVIDKLDNSSDKLGKYVKINRGIGLVSPNDNPKASLFTLTRSSDRDKPVFIGKDVSRYVTRWSQHWARIDDTTIAGGTRNPEVHEYPQKIIFPRIRNLKYKDRILASSDDRKIWVLDNYNILRVVSKDINPKFILALLNSKVLNFYFRNVFVDVNIKGTFIEKLPIPRIKLDDVKFKSLYDSVIACSANLLNLHAQTFGINLNFTDYLKEPILEHKTLRAIYDSLQAEEKKPSDLSSKGRIVDLNIIENNEWLVFNVDWITEDSSICYNHEVLRIKIVDVEWRKFIAGYISENKGKFIKYNLLSQILDRRLAIFDKDEKRNIQIIKRQMKPYVLAWQKSLEYLESI